MVSGVAGPCGQHVQNHVVKASKREAVPAQIHHQLMEESSALVKLNRRRIVMLSLAQVCNGVYEFLGSHCNCQMSLRLRQRRCQVT